MLSKRFACALGPVLSLVFSLLGAGTAFGDELFVAATGQRQGAIRGWYVPAGVQVEQDLPDAGWVDDLAWSAISPRDAASGLPTGRIQHRPLTLRLHLSGATVLLANAFRDSENLPTVRLSWRSAPAAGQAAEIVRELVLVNATISSFSTYTQREGAAGLVSYVDLQLTYQRIGIQDVVAGVSYDDDWERQVQ